MSTIYTSAEEAEDAFYEAIGRGDIDAIMQVWSDEEEIVCIHPTGQRIDGHTAIRESWRAVLHRHEEIVALADQLFFLSQQLATHSEAS